MRDLTEGETEKHKANNSIKKENSSPISIRFSCSAVFQQNQLILVVRTRPRRGHRAFERKARLAESFA